MRISATKLFVRDTREMETICSLKSSLSLTQSRRHVRLGEGQLNQPGRATRSEKGLRQGK